MRVMLAITKGEVGGAQEHVRILARGLLQQGHQVALVTPQPSRLAEWGSDMGADTIAWPSIRRNLSPRHDRRARRELRAAVARWAPDVLHLNSSKAGVVGVRLLRPPAGITVFTCHHAPFGPGRKLSHRVVARPVEQLMLPRLDGIITVGLRDQPMLRRIAPGVELRHIPNAVPVHGEPRSTGPMRPVAIWVARMAEPKDPLLAVRMWADVVARRPDARLILCGTGPLEELVRRAAAGSPVADAIECRGYVEDLGAARAEASLFVLCTRVEGGFTMATLEAMADGLVPVVSDAGDAPLLASQGCGVCVTSPGARPFADAVVALLDDPARFERLRAGALEYARRLRTPDQVLEETLDFYDTVLERARRGPGHDPG